MHTSSDKQLKTTETKTSCERQSILEKSTCHAKKGTKSKNTYLL